MTQMAADKTLFFAISNLKSPAVILSNAKDLPDENLPSRRYKPF